VTSEIPDIKAPMSATDAHETDVRKTLGTITQPWNRSLNPTSLTHRLTLGMYIALTFVGSMVGLGTPKEVVNRECRPAVEQPSLEFCFETRRFAHSFGQAATFVTMLALGAIAGAVTGFRWKKTVHDAEPPGVVDTLRRRTGDLRSRSGLLVLAAMPLIAGFGMGGGTDSSLVQAERSCRTVPFGTATDDVAPPTVVMCEQHSVEVERIVVTASPWSWPLRIVGLVLMVATLLWWVKARKLECRKRIPEYSHR
jgi:hypothetical protein